MRVLDFSDGFESESTPTQGATTANSLPVFASDAAFEADKGGAGAAGDVYFNSTSDKKRHHNGTDWVDDVDQVFASDAAYEADNGAGSAGDKYFNSTSNRQRHYDGSAWVDSAAAVGSLLSAVADYAVLDDDGVLHVLMTTAGTDRTVTLPTAADNTGRVIYVKKVDTGSGDCIVDGEGAETINGVTTYTMSMQNELLAVQCNGASWDIIHRIEPEVTVMYNTDSESVDNADAAFICNFEDKVFDTANNGADLVTVGASWVFTAPKTGRYQISTALKFTQVSWTDGEFLAMEARVNGSVVNRFYHEEVEVTGLLDIQGLGSAVLNVVKGDTVNVTVFQNTGAGLSVTATAGETFCHITKIR